MAADCQRLVPHHRGLESFTKKHGGNYFVSQVKKKTSPGYLFLNVFLQNFHRLFILDDIVKDLKSKYCDILGSHYLKYF